MTTRQCEGHTCSNGKGPSSFWMQDPERVFEILNILPGQHILDLGCGAGDYTLQAACLVGTSGLVTALDHWQPIVEAVETSARAAGLSQIRTLNADITSPPLPVKDNEMDLCMVFTVLHIFGSADHKDALFREAARILKHRGCLAVMECKKEAMPFGPPVHMRLSPEEVETEARKHGFQTIDYTDLGYNYLVRFSIKP